MKHNLTSVLIPLVLITVVGFAGTRCSDNSTDQETVRPVAVRVTQPIITDLQSMMSYMGTVHANREVKVIAQVQGTVISLKSEGADVATNEMVAEINVPDIRAAAERLQADVDYWQHRYQADQRLVAVEALPSEQMEVSLRAYRSAKAALAEAEAKLAKAREFSSIKGQALSWLVEPGQHVMPGQPILLIGNDELEIHVEVVEEDLRRGIRIGVPVKVQNWRGGKFQSEVSEVAPVASGPSRLFTVKLPVPHQANNAEDLRVGTSMRVDFILESTSNTVAVPLEAISTQGGNPHIFLVQENYAKTQPVTTGIEQNGWIAVVFPWNGKDRVAISNLGSLDDGALVFPVELKEHAK